ncbi:MAG TPA: NifU N-terminal domain-containing protein [Candidatus Thermoplasmatota archaeon]|nr:NifU N-terminal domain-containing protein [Candidatus Thermoplasmatota archaeon]
MARLRFDPTPNPNAMKVTSEGNFCNGSKIVSRPEQATSPLSKALLEVPGVQSLFFLNDFVTVTKRPEAEWDTILPHVQAALARHPHFV